jgi:hypothetical protein
VSILEVGGFPEPALPQFRIANGATEILGIAYFPWSYL